MKKPSVNYFATFFRSFIFVKITILTVYSFFYLFPSLDFPPDFSHKGTIVWAYLTFWNYLIQYVYLFLVLYEDYLVCKKVAMCRIDKLKSFNSYIFSSLVIPFTCITTILFWGFYLTNPYLLAPYSVLGVVPLFWQIGTHLLIIVPVITETIFAIRPISDYKTSWKYYHIAIFIYFLANVVAYVCFGQWTYKFLEEIRWRERFLTIFVIYVLGTTSFHLGMKAQHAVRAFKTKSNKQKIHSKILKRLEKEK